MYFTHLMRFAGKVEYPLGYSRFPGVNMGDNTYIASLCKVFKRGHVYLTSFLLLCCRQYTRLDEFSLFVLWRVDTKRKFKVSCPACQGINPAGFSGTPLGLIKMVYSGNECDESSNLLIASN